MRENNKNLQSKILSSSEIRLLAAIGFLSARFGLFGQASQIFEGLLPNVPGKPFVYIGLALAKLCIGEYTQAVSILRERGLVAFPDDPELSSWLVIALHYSGHSSVAIKIANDIKSAGDNDDFSRVFQKIFSNQKGRIFPVPPTADSSINAISTS